MNVKLAGVQYLRAIAAIAVVIDHAVAMAEFDKYFGERVPFFDFLVKGGLGVYLFFVISGFIIVVSSLERRTLRPKKGVLEFCKARVIRIVPMMWLAIVSYALMRWLGRSGAYDVGPYLNAMFLLPIGDYDPNNIWTLRQEIIFYVIFAISFLAGWRWGKAVFFIWVAISFVVLVGYVVPTYEIVSNVFYFGNVLFFVGVTVGLVYQRWGADFSFLQSNSTCVSFPALLLMFIVTMGLAELLGFGLDRAGVWYGLLIYSLLVFGGAVFVAGGDRFLLLLGEASYSIYLFHPHIESAMLGVLSKIFNADYLVPCLIFIVIVTMLISCGIYKYVERPLTRMLIRKFA